MRRISPRLACATSTGKVSEIKREKEREGEIIAND